MASWYNDLTLI